MLLRVSLWPGQATLSLLFPQLCWNIHSVNLYRRLLGRLRSRPLLNLLLVLLLLDVVAKLGTQLDMVKEAAKGQHAGQLNELASREAIGAGEVFLDQQVHHLRVVLVPLPEHLLQRVLAEGKVVRKLRRVAGANEKELVQEITQLSLRQVADLLACVD